MGRYWESIPRGVWTVIDAIDTLNALNDEESRARHYPEDNRVVIFGPENKAIIVELAIVFDSLSSLQDQYDFKEELKQYGICI